MFFSLPLLSVIPHSPFQFLLSRHFAFFPYGMTAGHAAYTGQTDAYPREKAYQLLDCTACTNVVCVLDIRSLALMYVGDKLVSKSDGAEVMQVKKQPKS